MTPKEFLWCGEGDLNSQATHIINNLPVFSSTRIPKMPK